MKVLWIVNTIFPYPSKMLGKKENCFGGWLIELANNLSKNEDISLGIVSVYDGKELKKYENDNIRYYLVPGNNVKKYSKKIEKYAEMVMAEFSPDILDIHGTEFAHSLPFIEKKTKNCKVISTIQGMVSVYQDVYLANISFSKILSNITFRDIITGSMFRGKNDYFKRGYIEKKIIEKSDAVLGRTSWDYSNAMAINPKAKYYNAEETLRESFYSEEWNINNIERHSLFTSQCKTPIKGLHYLLETLYLLKSKYSDVKLYIAGGNITDTSTLTKRLKLTGYGKIIKKMIHDLNLQDNVIFTGMLDEKSMRDYYLKSNVFVLPSAIENSSNSLCEAMILGVPCVASNTGGTMDMLKHEEEGLLFPYTEPAMCANYISKLFENDSLSIKYGSNARKRALQRHNRINNVNNLIKIYEELSKKDGKDRIEKK